MAQDYVNRATVDNDFDPSDKNQQTVVSNLASLTGLLSGLYQTNSLQNAIACSAAHPAAFVLCPNGIVINGMLVATPDQTIELTFNRESGTLTLSVDGRLMQVALGETFATKEEVEELMSASQAMVVAGTVSAATGKLTSVNATLFGDSEDWTDATKQQSSFSTLPRYIAVKAGWTFRVIAAGTTMGYGDTAHYEVGDQIQITTDKAQDGNAYLTPSDYTAIQNNIDVATTSALGLVKIPMESGLKVGASGNDGGKVTLNVRMTAVSDANTCLLSILDKDGTTVLASVTIPSASTTNAGLLTSADKERLDQTALVYLMTGSEFSLATLESGTPYAQAWFSALSEIDDEATIYIPISSGESDFVELQRGGTSFDTDTRTTTLSYFAIVTHDGEPYIYSFDVSHNATANTYSVDKHLINKHLVHDGDLTDDEAQFNYRTTAGSLSVADKAEGDVAKIKSVYGNTIVWNQLVEHGSSDGSLVTIPTLSGHKYYIYTSSGTIYTSDGNDLTNIPNTALVIDLSLMFGLGKEPTLAQFEAWLANYFLRKDYAYNAGELLNVKPNGIKTVGFNQWDEEWEMGIWDDNGSPVASTSQIRAKNIIHLFPNTTYYLSGPDNLGGKITFFTHNNNQISSKYIADFALNRVFTTPPNTAYCKMHFSANYGTTYNNNVCINLAWSGKRNGEYEEYWEEETLIPITTLEGTKSDGTREVIFPDGLKGIGDVRDEIVGNKAIKRVGSVDLGVLNYNFGINYFFTSIPELRTNYTMLGDGLLCAKFIASNATLWASVKEGEMGASSPNSVRFYTSSYSDADTFKAAMSGVILYYVLAEPIEYDLDQEFRIEYKCDDWGTEEILPENGTTPTTLPIIADIEYGMNALDTLARLHKDYVSVHPQNLSDVEKAQVQKNLGLDEFISRLTDGMMHYAGYVGDYFPGTTYHSGTTPDIFINRVIDIAPYKAICEKVGTDYVLMQVDTNMQKTGKYIVVDTSDGRVYQVVNSPIPSSSHEANKLWVFVESGSTVANVSITHNDLGTLNKGDMYFAISDYTHDGKEYHQGDIIVAEEGDILSVLPASIYGDTTIIEIGKKLASHESTLSNHIADLATLAWYKSYVNSTALKNAIVPIQSISVGGTQVAADASHNVNIPAAGDGYGVVKVIPSQGGYNLNTQTGEFTIVSGHESDHIPASLAKSLHDAALSRIASVNTSLAARITALEEALTWQTYPPTNS